MRSFVFILLLASLALPTASIAAGGADGSAELPDHPALLAPLRVDGPFPRFTAAELAAAGYPDHKHGFTYPGYEPPTTADGTTYGVYSLARGTQLLPREGLVTAPGEIRYRGLHVRFDPSLEPVGRMPLMEVLDWAEREVTTLLGHARPGTLHVIDPVDIEAYRDQTGQDFHRLYRRDGDQVIVEPAQVLFARGLALHAAFHLQTVWQLEGWLGADALPHWFSEGLASYLAEDGVHFLSYLAMYRTDGPVILDPARTEEILAAPPLADRELDKQRYRMASYSAYLMLWELVENRGGLRTLQTFLARVAAGEAPDLVSQELWDHDLAGLAASLDATTRPEPVGDAIQPRQLNRPPAR